MGRSIVFSAFYADFCFCSKLVIITTLMVNSELHEIEICTYDRRINKILHDYLYSRIKKARSPGSSVGWALAYWSSGSISILARGEIFSTVNGAPLHTAFHYQPPIVLIWLKHSWKVEKKSQVIHPSIKMATSLFHSWFADIDECLQSSNCQQGTCENTPGGYNCHCNHGYAGAHCSIHLGELEGCCAWDRRQSCPFSRPEEVLIFSFIQ